MGASTSKSPEEMTAADLAAYVATLGNSYKDYVPTIETSGLSVNELIGLDDECLVLILQSLGIHNRLHQRKLSSVIRKKLCGQGLDANSNHSISSVNNSNHQNNNNSQHFHGRSSLLDDSSLNTISTQQSTLSGSNYQHLALAAATVAPTSLSRSSSGAGKAPAARVSSSSSYSLSPPSMTRRFSDSMTAFHSSVSAATPPLVNRRGSTGVSPTPSSSKPPAPSPMAGAMENMCVAQSAEALLLLVNMENQKRLLAASEKPSEPPTKQAAIVLTDVQGSTALWEASPKAMRAALNLHDDIIRNLRADFSGYEIDTEGDAFFLAFHQAKDALAFALQLQEELRLAPWKKDILAQPEAAFCSLQGHKGLRVRIGIHFGPVTTRHNAVTGRLEYTGETMEKARQIETLAQGGQILTSRETWEVVTAGGKHNLQAKIMVPDLDDDTKQEKNISIDVVQVVPGAGVSRRNSNNSLLGSTNSLVSAASSVGKRPRRRKLRQSSSFQETSATRSSNASLSSLSRVSRRTEMTKEKRRASINRSMGPMMDRNKSFPSNPSRQGRRSTASGISPRLTITKPPPVPTSTSIEALAF